MDSAGDAVLHLHVQLGKHICYKEKKGCARECVCVSASEFFLGGGKRDDPPGSFQDTENENLLS